MREMRHNMKFIFRILIPLSMMVLMVKNNDTLILSRSDGYGI